MVLFWARTPCTSMQPSMDESRESSDNPPRVNRTEPTKVLQILLKFSNFMYTFLISPIQKRITRLDPD